MAAPPADAGRCRAKPRICGDYRWIEAELTKQLRKKLPQRPIRIVQHHPARASLMAPTLAPLAPPPRSGQKLKKRRATLVERSGLGRQPALEKAEAEAG